MRLMAGLLAATLVAALPSPAPAQQLIESYVAFLSEDDHFNSNGQRLRSAAAIIRQDRANFHQFGLRNRQDESDGYFADVNNRARLERMLEQGRSSPGAAARIVNGTALIRVDIYRGRGSDFISVTILD